MSDSNKDWVTQTQENAVAFCAQFGVDQDTIATLTQIGQVGWLRGLQALLKAGRDINVAHRAVLFDKNPDPNFDYEPFRVPVTK